MYKTIRDTASIIEIKVIESAVYFL